jgi:hypothetical protein
MKRVGAAVIGVTLVVCAFAMQGSAQNAAPDPRVGLKAGARDAGQAARNMEVVASVPKPQGFFDPAAPVGVPAPPEKKEEEDAKEPPKEDPARPPRRTGLEFGNSDMAFRRNQLFVGNFNGFNVYDISTPAKPRLISSVVCPGGQGDLSVHGNLLFMSVEETRGRVDCGTGGVQQTVSPERFRGVRIFDITDVTKPKQIAAVQTCRGSHTHTLVVDPHDSENVYIYGSGTSTVRSGEELAGCSGSDPKDDPNTSLFSIDVIQVPLASPEKARIVNRPRVFADPSSGSIAGLWPGGDHGPGTQKTSATNKCHDITVFPELGLAAGACSGNGILLDISDPVHPVRLDQVADKNFAFWHSATFNNDGTKVIFTDEWGGGTRPRCRASDQPTWGADAIFDIVDRKLKFASYYKMPAPQTDQENCVAHNGSIVPVPGRDIMVQAWYQGGVSVFDFTDSAKPVEIAYFDRGPLDAVNLIVGGFWSSYWYNGHVYGTEIARGLDVFRLTPSDQLSQHELDAAALAGVDEFNAQAQARVSWPANAVVARAYLDQLTRGNAIPVERAYAVREALDKKDGARLQSLAAELEKDASAATGRDAARLKGLAAAVTRLKP